MEKDTIDNLEKKIVDIIRILVSNKFTGELRFTLLFNQGGVRQFKKTIEDSDPSLIFRSDS